MTTRIPDIDYKSARFTDPRYIACPDCAGRRAGCPHCHFWGTVLKGSPEAACVHRWAHVGTISRCLNSFQCTVCGRIKTVDSSD